MNRGDAKQAGLGFLTVVTNPSLGLFGGFLVLNDAGRPLEFHCTAPVKPNRAQEILYGPTLNDFLYGEQIGQTLVAEASTRTALVCTDVPQMLTVREFISQPVALVCPQDDASEPVADLRIDATHAAGAAGPTFRYGQQLLAVSRRHASDAQPILAHLKTLEQCFDLAEPFARIREAIAEAQGGARP